MSNDKDFADEWTADIEELEKEIARQETGKYYLHYFLMFLLGVLLIPFASYLVHYIVVLSESFKISQMEDDEAVKAIVSAAVALPFYISYKITKPYGKPKINAFVLSLLAVIGVILFIEYIYFIDYFLLKRAGKHLTNIVFLKDLIWGLKHKWLFSVPLIVIWIDIIAYTNIIKYCEPLSILAETESDEIKFVFYAVIAIVISAIIRMIFLFV